MRKDDLEALYKILSDDKVMKHLEAKYTKQKTIAFLDQNGLSEPPRIYAAEDDGEFIGYVIFHEYDRSSMEIGWVLDYDYWGKGYASKLTEMLLEKCKFLNKEAVIECAWKQEVSKHIAMKYDFVLREQKDGLYIFRKQ